MFKAFLLTILVVGSVYLFIKYLKEKLSIVKWGKDEVRWDNPNQRLKIALDEVILQKKVIGGKFFVGLMHAFVFWGFCVFALGTIHHFGEGYGLHLLDSLGWFGSFYKFLLMLFAWLVTIGIVALEIRRFVFKPPELTHPSTESAIIAGLIFFLMITYILGAGGILQEGSFLHGLNWWAHVFMILGFLVYIPKSKHLHLMFAPFNIFFRTFNLGQIPTPKMPITEEEMAAEGDEEEELDMGVNTLTDLSWKDLFDAWTCIECGRCQEQCPAYNSQKALNPKFISVDLKHYMSKDPKKEESILGNAYMEEEVIWQCTTCGACQYWCPVGVEHIPKIIGLRRFQVQELSKFPEQAQVMFTGLENNGNPWKMGEHLRSEYLGSLDMKPFEPGMEYMFFVGCFGALDPRAQKITKALVQVLNAAGVSYGYLDGEVCCGDPARKLGNEFLYQMTAMQNIEMMKELGVEKVITFCPHCSRTLFEYRELGLQLKEITHHSLFLHKLLNQGKLKLSADGGGIFVFHDPCYMSRYMQVFEQPRELIRACGYAVVDPERARDRSFCCGGGGGMTFCEESKGERINQIRSKELYNYSDKVAVACPYCMTMISDGMKEIGKENAVVKDIAEVMAERLPKGE